MYIYRIILLLLISFFAIAPPIFAETRTVSTSGELKAALSAAESGDVVLLEDGVYNGNFRIATRGVTIRGRNRHKAILRGDGTRNESNYGLSLDASKVTIEDLRFESHYWAIWANGSVNEVAIRHNIITHFKFDGVHIIGNQWQVYNNVIGLSQQTESNGRGVYINSGEENIVYGNMIYAISGDNVAAYGPETGGCFFIRHPSKGNLVQGNMCVVGGDKNNATILTGTGGASTNTHNIFRDNIFAWGDAGGFSTRDRRSNDNSFINNLCYEVHNCVGGKGNSPGRNKILHNTVIVTEFSGPVAMEAGTDEGVTEQNRVFKSNLIYSKVKHSGKHYNFLHATQNAKLTYKGGNHSHNLYWAPWSSGNWAWSNAGSFPYSSTDIHSSSKRPIFVDEDKGDYTLAPNSPGAGAGHDGKNIGIEWNEHLTLTKFQHLLELPTQEKSTDGGTSVSFSGLSKGHEYLVEVYIPSKFYNGTETYQIEGKKVSRELGTLFNGEKWYSGRWYSGANRYVTLGNHPVSDDGVLTIKWTHGNAAQRVFIRELPTPSQAYRWINPESEPEPEPIPEPEPTGPVDPYHQIESETFADIAGARRVNEGTLNDAIGSISHRGWALYRQVDFGEGAILVQVYAATKNTGLVQFRLDRIDGPLLGICDVTSTGSWSDWQWFSTPVEKIQGVHDLYLVFEGKDGRVDNLMNLGAFVFEREGG